MACTIIISAHKVKSDKRKPDGTDWDQSYFVLKMKYYTNANFPSTELHNIREFHLILLILFFQATADWILKFNLMITFALTEQSTRIILPCKSLFSCCWWTLNSQWLIMIEIFLPGFSSISQRITESHNLNSVESRRNWSVIPRPREVELGHCGPGSAVTRVLTTEWIKYFNILPETENIIILPHIWIWNNCPVLHCQVWAGKIDINMSGQNNVTFEGECIKRTLGAIKYSLRKKLTALN